MAQDALRALPNICFETEGTSRGIPPKMEVDQLVMRLQCTSSDLLPSPTRC
jgi:hypothetical protein